MNGILKIVLIACLFSMAGCETMQAVGRVAYERSTATASSQPQYACGGFYTLPANDATFVAHAAQACAKVGY